MDFLCLDLSRSPAAILTMRDGWFYLDFYKACMPTLKMNVRLQINVLLRTSMRLNKYDKRSSLIFFLSFSVVSVRFWLQGKCKFDRMCHEVSSMSRVTENWKLETEILTHPQRKICGSTQVLCDDCSIHHCFEWVAGWLLQFYYYYCYYRHVRMCMRIVVVSYMGLVY